MKIVKQIILFVTLAVLMISNMGFMLYSSPCNMNAVATNVEQMSCCKNNIADNTLCKPKPACCEKKATFYKFNYTALQIITSKIVIADPEIIPAKQQLFFFGEVQESSFAFFYAESPPDEGRNILLKKNLLRI